MALPACRKCGRTNPRKMIGLMTLWFGPFADLEPDYGYFHLCPSCYRKWVKPHFDLVQGRLAELHPSGHLLDRHGRGAHQEPDDGEPDGEGAKPVPAGGTDDATGSR